MRKYIRNRQYLDENVSYKIHVRKSFCLVKWKAKRNKSIYSSPFLNKILRDKADEKVAKKLYFPQNRAIGTQN